MAKKEESPLHSSFIGTAALFFFAAVMIGGDIDRMKMLKVPASAIAEKMQYQTYCWYGIAISLVIAVVLAGFRNYAGLRRRKEQLAATTSNDSSQVKDVPSTTKTLVRRDK